jgi:hypothetical protein
LTLRFLLSNSVWFVAELSRGMRVAFFLPVNEIRGGINDRIVNRISVLRAYGPVGGSRAAELLGKDPVLLAKVINDLQLELIHGDQHKPE